MFNFVFFFKQKTAYEMRISDWSSDVCSSDLVEIADDDAERSQGLMYRRELAPDHGMLFVFDRPIMIAMWMKNTPLPLDMLFISSNGKVVDLHERAVPFSLDTIAAGRRARYVLEVIGGTVDRLGLAVGDTVLGAGIGGP